MSEPGSVELAPGVPDDIKAKLEGLRLSPEERAETCANSMWGMYNFTALRALMLANGDWEKANEICGRCPRKDSLDTVNEVSAKRGMPSPLAGYDLFAICAGGAEGYERVMSGVKGEGLKGMCKGDDHCEFRYYRRPS